MVVQFANASDLLKFYIRNKQNTSKEAGRANNSHNVAYFGNNFSCADDSNIHEIRQNKCLHIFHRRCITDNVICIFSERYI